VAASRGGEHPELTAPRTCADRGLGPEIERDHETLPRGTQLVSAGIWQRELHLRDQRAKA
jgi:hypothetical protein